MGHDSFIRDMTHSEQKKWHVDCSCEPRPQISQMSCGKRNVREDELLDLEIEEKKVKLAVHCNGSMYGKTLKDMPNMVYSDAVVRFRTHDDKMVVTDLLVGMGRCVTEMAAHALIREVIDDQDRGGGIMGHLDRLEADSTLLDDHELYLATYEDALKILETTRYFRF